MKIAVTCASHDPTILAANLARSPCIAEGRLPLHVETGAPSAAVAYNRALAATARADVVVFAHHDVYLPRGWDLLLAERLQDLAQIDPTWALAAAFGIGLDGREWGPVWSSSLGFIAGRVPLAPEPIQSCDEMLIVLNRASGLTWDESLPDWHLYGTDIVTQARARGLGAWAPGLPCLHNDRYHGPLDQGFRDGLAHQRRKWRDRLPIRTPITKIDRSGLAFWRAQRRDAGAASTAVRQAMAVGTDHAVEALAARCGWADLTPGPGG